MKEHHYNIINTWDGQGNDGNKQIRSYSRSHTIAVTGKPELRLTTDNKHVGDPAKLNPEDLLLASISSCHMLSYLYVCALEGIVILEYTDNASGLMIENEEGGGQFKEVVLHPFCLVAEENMIAKAIELHHKAHEVCYIANSVNFEVRCEPVCKVKE